MSGGWRWRDLRPLDAVQSIKVKLAVLVGVSVTASVLLSWLSLVVFGWELRWALLLSVGACLVVTQLLARGMTSPLRQMTAAARELAAGRPASPVATTSRDEVGQLARAFAAMAEEIAGADSQRRELVADVAHELRTPVAALRAQLENAVDGVRPADPTALTEMLAQAESLGELVDELLDLARGEAGVVRLQRVPVQLAPLAAEVVAAVDAARPGRRVLVTIGEDLVVHVDPRRLRQVLLNLVDNAARHTRPGGRVEIVARLDDAGGLVVDVSDDGPGIPVPERRVVFERFRRGSRGHPADGGTGLGLAIARWAVELHGGRIGVVPAERGCLVRVELPGDELGSATGRREPRPGAATTARAEQPDPADC